SKRCVSVRDPVTGRFSPQYDENERKVYQSDYIILATGQAVDISFLGDKFLDQLKSARGLIDVDLSTFKTNRPGMYAGGDVATGPNIAIRAINAGHVAAMGMSRDLGFPFPAEPKDDGFRTFDTKGVLVHESNKLGERPIDQRTLTDEDEFSLSAEQTLAEASRCMNCSCHAVNPGDIAPVLVAADAKIVTTKRVLDAEDFFAVGNLTNTVLDEDEIVTEIQIPAKGKSVYKRMALRKSIDFPIVNVAVSSCDGKTRICLNAVAPTPYRAVKAEEVVSGKEITEELAAKAGEAAVADACSLEDAKFKIQIAKTMVKRALLEL
ncbi:MAG: FAD binding domain-containing protein, partial [Oscillospiraceae bacterium]|nr:FAD binding domain-containing protein [Oscillospiraceae bacterium]